MSGVTDGTDLRPISGEDQGMVIPFKLARKPMRRQNCAAATSKGLGKLELKDGSYLVGILDGNVIGASALSKRLCILDPTDAAEVLVLVKDLVAEDIRALIREELLKID